MIFDTPLSLLHLACVATEDSLALTLALGLGLVTTTLCHAAPIAGNCFSANEFLTHDEFAVLAHAGSACVAFMDSFALALGAARTTLCHAESKVWTHR